MRSIGVNRSLAATFVGSGSSAKIGVSKTKKMISMTTRKKRSRPSLPKNTKRCSERSLTPTSTLSRLSKRRKRLKKTINAGKAENERQG